MLTIDGSMGEGGGQLLRSSLALSLLTSTPFRITKIRAGRARPGLMRQHLVAVNAATEIGDAEANGAEIGSVNLTFQPKAIRAGNYKFAISGAGSTTLVFQTILLPLLLGSSVSSTITFEGGTHNPMAPPFEFLEHSFLPILARMGACVEVALSRHGFYPAGGGRWTATILPVNELERLELLQRGEVRSQRTTALISQLRPSIALRELDVLCNVLGWDRASGRPQMIEQPHGPGNALLAIIESEHVTEVVTGFGERGLPAESIAERVAAETRRYLKAGVPVGAHLADQLLLPLAFGRGGTFRTLKPTAHFTTQVELLRMFLGTKVTATEEAEDVWKVDVGARTA